MTQKDSEMAIIGCYPPPYGGVTTHTLRLRALMDKAGIRYKIYNTASEADDPPKVVSVHRSRASFLLKYFLFGKEPIVYIMSRNRVLWLFGALLALLRRKKVILRLQCAQLLYYKNDKSIMYPIVGWMFRRMHGIVCVNRELLAVVRDLGVAEDRSWWFPGFLPPAEWERDTSRVAPAMLEFAAKRKPFIPVAARVLWQQGYDLYGLDMMVELAARLKPDYPELGIGICAWGHDPQNEAYLEKLQQRVNELGIQDNVFFNKEKGLFVPLLFKADVSLRPTYSDGDANSLREALYLGVPSVASDATERPPGCYLFKNRDLDDFEAKTREALEKGVREDQDQQQGTRNLTRGDLYLEFLKELTGVAQNPVEQTHQPETSNA